MGIDHDEDCYTITESDALSDSKDINQISSSKEMVGDKETAEDSKENATMEKQRKSRQISQQEGIVLANQFGMLFMELTLHKSNKLLNFPPNQSESISISNPNTTLTLQEDKRKIKTETNKICSNILLLLLDKL